MHLPKPVWSFPAKRACRRLQAVSVNWLNGLTDCYRPQPDCALPVAQPLARSQRGTDGVPVLVFELRPKRPLRREELMRGKIFSSCTQPRRFWRDRLRATTSTTPGRTMGPSEWINDERPRVSEKTDRFLCAGWEVTRLCQGVLAIHRRDRCLLCHCREQRARPQRAACPVPARLVSRPLAGSLPK